MAYPFVQAMYYTAGGFRELRGFVVHHAEGGGTVSWLTHPTNDNSSDYVIEYSGRIVQMVRDGDASHSLHVARPYGPPGPGDYGIFSLDTAKAVLGTGISDPNRYIKVVELEGFASAGPNAAQRASLAVLVNDLRSRFPTLRGNLGHRDFQNYKPCPGGLIPWAAIGGHGLYGAAAPGGLEMFPVVTRELLPDPNPRTWTVAAGATINGYDPAQPGQIVLSRTFTALSSAHATHRVRVEWQNLGGAAMPVPSGYPFLLANDGIFAGLLIVEAAVTLDADAPSGDATAAYTKGFVEAKGKAVLAAKGLAAALESL